MTGLSRQVIAGLVAELAPRWQARHRDRLATRTRRRRIGAGAKHRLAFTDRPLAALVHLRHGLTHDVVAAWFGAHRSTITRSVAEVRPLLAERGCRVHDGARLRTLADVVAYPRPRRRSAHRPAVALPQRPTSAAAATATCGNASASACPGSPRRASPPTGCGTPPSPGVESHFSYGVARAYAGHTDQRGPVTTPYIKADLHAVAAALAAMTANPTRSPPPRPHPTGRGWSVAASG
ncbi:transposase family protein [Micromonospora sp. NPDC052213]|uniref:helix-turn-helix domain-containing protein n=1 Tax=Micromonospora sp. NPDC052213 TaxID=3155812 RepID=UPI00342FFD16